MGWFRRDGEAAGDVVDEHPAPVQIDLGLRQRPWEAEVLVQKLTADGLQVHLTTQSQIPEMTGGLGPKRCLLLVSTRDEARVRVELAAAGLL